MKKELREQLLIELPLMPRTEQDEQTAYFDWAKLQHNRLPDMRMTVHAANEGKRSFIHGKAMQRSGLVRGVLDVINISNQHPFAIEMKVSDNEPTPEQTWWLSVLHYDNTPIALAYNAQEAMDFTEAVFAGAGGVYQKSLAHRRAMLWLNHVLIHPLLERSPYGPKPSNRLVRNW